MVGPGAVAIVLAGYDSVYQSLSTIRLSALILLWGLYICGVLFIKHVFRKPSAVVQVSLPVIGTVMFCLTSLGLFFRHFGGIKQFWPFLLIVLCLNLLPIVSTALKKVGWLYAPAVLLFQFLPMAEKMWMDVHPILQIVIRLFLVLSVSNLIAYYVILLVTVGRVHHSVLQIPSRINRILFYVLFSASYFVMYMANTYAQALSFGGSASYDSITKLTIAVCLLLFSVDFCEEKVRWVAILQLVLLAGATVYYVTCGDIWIYILYALAMASRHASEKVLVGSALIIRLAGSLFAYCMSMTGYLPYIVSTNVDGIKHAFGFYDANGCSMHLLFIVLLYLYLRKRKIGLDVALDLCILFFAYFFVKSYSGGRTSIMGLAYLLGGTYLFDLAYLFAERAGDLAKKINKYFQLIWAQGVLAGCLLFSFGISWIYNEENDYFFLRLIERVFDTGTLRSRLYYGNIGLHTYAPTLFGRFIIESNQLSDYFWLDNFYVRALLKYGIIILVGFIVLMAALNVKLWKKGMYYQMFILSVIPIMGILEALIGDPMYNIFPILVLAIDGANRKSASKPIEADAK